MPPISRALFNKLSRSLAAAPLEDERTQSWIRVVVVSLIAAHTVFVVDVPKLEALTGLPGWVVPTVILLYSAALVVWIVLYPQPCTPRRVSALILDLSACSLGLVLTDQYGVFWYPLYLLVVFGNAFCFGLAYLVAGMVISVIGFGAVLVTSDYWQNHQPLGLGLLFGLIVLPICAAPLLQSRRAALETARAASEAKTRLLASLRHELCTPLNGVMGAGDRLMGTPLTPAQRDLLGPLQTSARTLLDLTEHVLEISTIGAGTMTQQHAPFDLYRLVRGVTDIVTPRAPAEGRRIDLFIDTTLPHRLRGSEHHLRQLLLNVLGNAVQCTERGRVALHVRRAQQAGEHVRVQFEIHDTDSGIPDAAKTRILDAQADASTPTDYDCGGPGTPMARLLIQLMGGSIGVDHTKPARTTVWFKLDFLDDTVELKANDLAGLRALTVGVNPNSIAVLRRTLKPYDVRIDAATDPDTARRGLRQSGMPAHSALLVSMNPGDASDVAVLEAIQSGLGPACPPAIGLTNLGPQNPNAINPRLLALVPLSDSTSLVRALYAAKPGHQTPPVTLHSIETDRTAHILVAEDNRTSAKVLCALLQTMHHTTETVNDGRAALESLRSNAFDLVIVDMHMPGIGGLDVIRTYRKAHPTSKLPFVLLTADATPAAVRERQRIDADGYLTKPVDANTLRDTIQALTASEATLIDSTPRTQRKDARPAPSDSLLDPCTVSELQGLGHQESDFFPDLVAQFARQLNDCLDNMRLALADGHWQALCDQAHQLRGTSATLGALELHQCCADMEDLLVGDFPDQLSRLLERIAATGDCTLNALLAEVANATSSPLRHCDSNATVSNLS